MNFANNSKFLSITNKFTFERKFEGKHFVVATDAAKVKLCRVQPTVGLVSKE